jgi:hypothetical protein
VIRPPEEIEPQMVTGPDAGENIVKNAQFVKNIRDLK